MARKKGFYEVGFKRRCAYRHIVPEGEFHCKWRHPIEIEKDLRIAYLDIEASNLDADFGQIYSYAIKPQGQARVISNVVTARSLDAEKELLVQFLQDVAPFNCWVTYYGCVTAGHRVLTSDLRWIPVEKLRLGDDLLAITVEESKGRQKAWKPARVVDNRPVTEVETSKIRLCDGSELTATADHPWLIFGTSGYRWVSTARLKPGDQLERLLIPQPEPTTYEAGWLAAFFDSEGSLGQSPRKNSWGRGYGLTVTATQQLGPVLDQAQQYLDKMGIDYGISSYDPTQPHMRAITVRGGVRGILAFLGKVRPMRLLQRLSLEKLGALKSEFKPEPGVVESIKSAGRQTIYALGTTTETYIVEGFGSHNTGFDIPFLRARCMYHGLNFPGYGNAKHIDLYYVARGRMKLSSRRLANVASFLDIEGKTPLKGKIWVAASMGDREALKYILHHNIEDVRVLEQVHARLEPYMRPIRRSI